MIYNLGSINLDHIYQVAEFPQPGETLSATRYQCLPGGKGLNQSVAAARAGASVAHIGACDSGADLCLDLMAQAGIDLTHVDTSFDVTGHAIIYLNKQGENQIVILAGANQQIDSAQIHTALAASGPQDWLIMQNETCGQLQAARIARQSGCKVAYSAAPFDADQVATLLPELDLIAVNEGEAAAVQSLLGRGPEHWGAQVLITMGEKGARFFDGTRWFEQPAIQADVVDTTGAGDTFLGYFVARIDVDGIEQALATAARAASIQVSRPGAAPAIPELSEVL